MRGQSLTVDPTPVSDPDLASLENWRPPGHLEFGRAASDHAGIHTLIVAELFPPSEAMRLRKALERLRCRDSLNLLRGDRNTLPPGAVVSTSAWWRLGVLVTDGGTSAMPNARRRRLPAEFDRIELAATRIGDGFCAVVATFYTTGSARSSVDDGGSTRSSLRRIARRWLGAEVPGFFATNDESQPLLEVTLADPSATARTGLEPGAMNLERASSVARTWTLWGLAPAAGGDIRATAGCAARAARGHLVRLSISELLSAYLARYVGMRDQAHGRLGFVRIRHLEAQRDNLVSLSLNVGTIDRAVRAFHDDHANQGAGRHDAAIRQLASDQRDMLDQLKEADELYRTILPVSASLASSMQALRASRIARWIASLSLVTSLLLLFLADTATSPRIVTFVHWLTSH